MRSSTDSPSGTDEPPAAARVWRLGAWDRPETLVRATLRTLPITSDWVSWFFLKPITEAAPDHDMSAVFGLPTGTVGPDTRAVVMVEGVTLLASEEELIVAAGQLPTRVEDGIVTETRIRLTRAAEPLATPDLDGVACVAIGEVAPWPAIAMRVRIDRAGIGVADIGFQQPVVADLLARLAAVGIAPSPEASDIDGFQRVRFDLHMHLAAAETASYSRGANCNEFFLSHAAQPPQLLAGLRSAAHGLLATTRSELIRSAEEIAGMAGSGSLMTCRSPDVTVGFGDLVPLGILLAGLRTPCREDLFNHRLVVTVAELGTHLRSNAKDGGFAFNSGGMTTAIDSSLVLLGLPDADLIRQLDRYGDGVGGFHAQRTSDINDATTAFWAQPDDFTTCLIRFLRRTSGLPEVTPIDWVTRHFDTRGSVFVACPWLIDWAYALALKDDPDPKAQTLRSTLGQEVLASANPDWSFGHGNQAPLATAAAICALDALADPVTLLPRHAARLRLVAMLQPGLGTRPLASVVPFVSVRLIARCGTVVPGWEQQPARAFRALLNPSRPGILAVEDDLYELTSYEDTAGAVLAGLALRALRTDVAPGEQDSLPKMAQHPHPRYRTTVPEYVRAIALRPVATSPVAPDLTPSQRDPLVPRVGSSALGALAAATAVGKRLASTSIEGPDNVDWLIASRGPTESLPRRCGFDLYSGRAGIGLFLAGLYAVSGEIRWRDLALRSYGLCDVDESQRRHIGASLGFGAHSGAVGLVYSLIVAGHLLAEPDLRTYAQDVLHGLASLDPGQLDPQSGARAIDLGTGLAGSVLGLSRVYEQTGDPLAQDIAATCSTRMLALVEQGHRESPPGPLRDAVFRSGYAHAGTGIAAAAAVFSTVANDPRFARVAAELIHHQDEEFDPRIPGWRDGRDPSFYPGNSWCWGQAGHLLGRFQIDHATRLLDPQDQARVALTRDALLGSTTVATVDDTICCGAAGLLEVDRLLTGPPASSHTAWRQAALTRMTDAVVTGGGCTARIRGRESDPTLSLPGLFQGDSGVGWALLTAAEPMLPNIMDWQVPVE